MHIQKRIVGVSLGLCVMSAVFILRVPPTNWLVIWIGIILVSSALTLGIMAVSHQIRRSILFGFVLAGLVGLRVFELDTLINIGLLAGLAVVIEIYCWE